ncbi:hypothetical protein CHU_3442 [Cytophaga hutchinsonii ATCC 33406]|uniref:Uncharacterized protein n=1 Tax=Cytophaga hutchinsonii (strain ATCC 33406 / DSM 1761 / CIP 103989 / NBRC 15051 / NCIMB 9469 / D465) TaxID=269798 RepID=A0A6N4SWA4_CYTH3|nr:hypothetical protein CHU_3442 [Cytophaga hutchinsonii ATCC 33406]SFX69336.1 hypothetical protein SAMN04487930_1082 [Cytophaga hutchinsonii ATCC 33406]
MNAYIPIRIIGQYIGGSLAIAGRAKMDTCSGINSFLFFLRNIAKVIKLLLKQLYKTFVFLVEKNFQIRSKIFQLRQNALKDVVAELNIQWY